MAKCQHYTFDGVFHYKWSFMLIHLYIGWVLVYGWMTCLVLLHKGQNTKKHDFGDFFLESSFFVIEPQTLLQMCSRGCF